MTYLQFHGDGCGCGDDNCDTDEAGADGDSADDMGEEVQLEMDEEEPEM